MLTPTGESIFDNISHIVDPNGVIPGDDWALPVVYKLNQRNKWDVWQIMFDGEQH